MATSRIKLGTSITSVFVRTAPTIAMAAATVDHFSNGRFILGLGSSHKVQVEPEHGLEFNRPIERMRECTDIVRGILRDSDIKYHGEVNKIERFDLWFEPVRRQMPIYFAAVRPRMLEICGEISDGVILTWCTLAHAATAVHHIAEGARRAGRSPGRRGCDDTDSLRCLRGPRCGPRRAAPLRRILRLALPPLPAAGGGGWFRRRSEGGGPGLEGGGELRRLWPWPPPGWWIR